jgi:hypothetical protein
VTINNTYGSESESTKMISKDQPTFKSIGLGEYIQPFKKEDSNDAILNWENSPVLMITTEQEFEEEPSYQTDFEKLIENMSHVDLLDIKPPKSICIDMNLGTKKSKKY